MADGSRQDLQDILRLAICVPPMCGRNDEIHCSVTLFIFNEF